MVQQRTSWKDEYSTTADQLERRIWYNSRPVGKTNIVQQRTSWKDEYGTTTDQLERRI